MTKVSELNDFTAVNLTTQAEKDAIALGYTDLLATYDTLRDEKTLQSVLGFIGLRNPYFDEPE